MAKEKTTKATAPAVEESKTATKAVTESVKATASPVKLGINITNTRMGVKKISLPSGVLTLYPGVITRVPEQDEDAVRMLFKADTFKRMIDKGAFRFTDYDTAEGLVAQATPAPPADLSSTQPINALNKDTKTVQDLQVVAVHDATPAVE